MPTLRLKLFGHPEVRIAGEEVTGFHSSKSRALLFYLAVTGRPQARTVLAGMFWGDFPEDRAMSNLRKTLSNLRKLVGDHLEIGRERVAFDQTSDHWLDVAVFEAGLAALESGGDFAATERAVALYQGDFLEGFYLDDAPEWESWTLASRLRLRQGYQTALLELANHHAEGGDYVQAIDHAQRLLNQEPLREDTQRLLMTLYAKNGQRARALRQYETCRMLLEDKLDVEPASETQALAEAIRAGRVRSVEKRWGDGQKRPVPSVSPQQPGFLEDETEPGEAEQPLFIGRERELAQLEDQLNAVLTGHGRITFVTGEAGQGKTALLAEFAHRAQEHHPDLIVASGNCNAFSGKGDPFHPFREILELLSGNVESRWRVGAITREQARRLWELTPKTAQALAMEGKTLLETFISGAALLQRASAHAVENPPWLARLREFVEEGETGHQEQGRLLTQFTAVLGALAQQNPLLLVLDDLQWADNSSLDLLFHLSRHLSEQSIFILGAYRPSDVTLARLADQEIGSTTLLLSLAAELKRRFGQNEIDLGLMSAQAEREFVDALIDSEPNRLGEPFRTTFYQHTRGHPLFSIELLREMQARGDLIWRQEGFWEAAQELDWDRLPTRVEAVIAQRVSRLDKEHYEILAAASVEGENFAVQTVARVLDLDERRLLRQLASLQKEHRLVREVAEVILEGRRLVRYQFTHILFQQYLYQNLSQGEQRLLHEGIATALEDLYAGHTQAILPRLAYHFAEAGLAKESIPYLLAAGDQARIQNAYREAIAHYRRALTFLKELGDHEGAARTLMKIGLTHHNASAFEQARAANEEAFRLWQQVARGEVRGSLPQAPHALRVGWRNFSGKLDPAMVKEVPRALPIQQLFSGLLRLGQDLDILPDVAYGWDVLDQGRRYLFHLRQNVRWSDGAPVTAADFECAWKRVLDPTTGSPNAAYLFDVKGARSFHLGRGDPDGVAITALDDATLKVELNRISPYFPNMLIAEFTKPVPRHAIEKHGPSWMEPDNIVTNGPFSLVSWNPGELLVLARNPDYHGSFRGNVEQAEIYLGEDHMRQLEMYLAGELDVLYTFSNLPPDIQESLREELVSEYRSGPALGTWAVGFVLSRPPFDDRRVRRAFALATDRHTLANVVRRGLVFPATGGFLSPVHAAFSEGIALPYDPDRARRLLAEAGYPDGKGLPTIKMVNGHASLRVEAELRYLQAQWREHLGVNMTWETIWEMADFLHQLRQDPPHLFYIGWTGKYTDPDDFLRETSLVWELARWHDQKYVALVNRAREVVDGDERMALYRQADRMLVEEAVLLPLNYTRTQLLVKPWVRRFAYAAISSWFFQEVILEPHPEAN